MGGRGKENYKFLPHSPEGRENRARKKKRRRGRWVRRAGASEAEGRANQMKFDIFDKRPALELHNDTK